jgi:hypothetical protein
MGQRLHRPEHADDVARRTLAVAAGDNRGIGCAVPDVLATAAERLKQARKLPPGPERNELRQIAIALRWLATHQLSPERQQRLRDVLERDARDS